QGHAGGAAGDPRGSGSRGPGPGRGAEEAACALRRGTEAGERDPPEHQQRALRQSHLRRRAELREGNVTAIAEASSQDLPISQEAAEPSSASAGLRSGVAWLSVAAATIGWPDKIDFVEFGRTTEFAILTGLFGLAVLLAGLRGSRVPALGARIIRWMPWLLLSAGGLLAWQILTAKLGVLPMPFFPPPQSILEVFIDDWPRMLNSVWHSALLLAGGFALGAAAGFVTGVAVGWS